jgi:DNA-directed RNA polymerase subunit RPC12/RpoP
MLLDLLKSLVVEHGSATVIKERLALAVEHATAQQRRCDDLEAQCRNLQLDLEQCKKEIAARAKYDRILCNHCNSPDTRLIGQRLSKDHGMLGFMANAFHCNTCGADFENPIIPE